MNCRDEVTNRDLQDSYLTLCLARESKITKSLSFMGSELQSHDHGSRSPSCRHHKSSHPRSSQWRACCRLCTCDVVTDQVPRRLTPLYRPLWLRSPLGSESPRPGRKRGPSRSGFKLAHNKHTRTKISSAIDGQLLIQHHINQQGTKLQIVHTNIIQTQNLHWK